VYFDIAPLPASSRVGPPRVASTDERTPSLECPSPRLAGRTRVTFSGDFLPGSVCARARFCTLLGFPSPHLDHTFDFFSPAAAPPFSPPFPARCAPSLKDAGGRPRRYRVRPLFDRRRDSYPGLHAATAARSHHIRTAVACLAFLLSPPSILRAPGQSQAKAVRTPRTTQSRREMRVTQKKRSSIRSHHAWTGRMTSISSQSSWARQARASTKGESSDEDSKEGKRAGSSRGHSGRLANGARVRATASEAA